MVNPVGRRLSLAIVAISIVSLDAPESFSQTDVTAEEIRTIGRIESHDARFEKLVPPDAVIEIVADSFRWSEGPVWIPESGGYVLFSDVPANTIYRWSESDGLSTWLTPSGYTGTAPREASNGSNGLALDADGRLVLAQHGDRRIARFTASLDDPSPSFETIADRWDGKRFNSPNDLVYDSDGNLYLTDPPFGLPGRSESPEKEIPFSGVYRVTPEGEVTLISDDLAFPNGIALSPDERRLYVTNSQRDHKVLVVHEQTESGDFGDGRVLVDMTELPGGNSPDGLKIDVAGNIYTTGPEGVYVFAPDGTKLGTIHTGIGTANVAWGDDGRTLYITAHVFLLRVKTLARGLGFPAG